MAVRSLHNEAELLAKIANGDQRAFKIIYDTYYNTVFKFAFRLLHEKEPAEEIVQETMLYVWQLGYKLKDIKNIESYLKTITKRKSINSFHRKLLEEKVEKQLAAEYMDGHNETEQGISMREARKILQDGVELLPFQQQQVYKLCQQQGLKYEEAAEQLQISHGTVQTHMKLALKFLRNYIQKHTDLAVLLIIFKII